MATKLDTDKKLFLGKTAVREATTFGAIRKAVNELNAGEGVSYADLQTHLLANFKPTKSANYGESYIKSYVRDAVNKFGYLSHEDQGNTYEVLAAVEKAEAPAKEKKLTKKDNDKLDILALLRDKGEVRDVSELDSTKITAATIMEVSKKKQKTVDGLVADLEKAELVRTEKVEDSLYVFLTPTGFNYVNENRTDTPAPTEPAEGTAAETVSEDDNESGEA